MVVGARSGDALYGLHRRRGRSPGRPPGVLRRGEAGEPAPWEGSSGVARASSSMDGTTSDLTVWTPLERPRKGQTRRHDPARGDGDARRGPVLRRRGVDARSRTQHVARGHREVLLARCSRREAQESHGRRSSATAAVATDARSEEGLEVERGPAGVGTQPVTARRQVPVGDGEERRCVWGKLWRASAPEGKSRNQQVSGVVSETR